MAIQKQAARRDWTPWTPFCKRSMDSCQPDMPQPNWPGTVRTCRGTRCSVCNMILPARPPEATVGSAPGLAAQQ